MATDGGKPPVAIIWWRGFLPAAQRWGCLQSNDWEVGGPPARTARGIHARSHPIL